MTITLQLNVIFIKIYHETYLLSSKYRKFYVNIVAIPLNNNLKSASTPYFQDTHLTQEIAFFWRNWRKEEFLCLPQVLQKKKKRKTRNDVPF